MELWRQLRNFRLRCACCGELTGSQQHICTSCSGLLAPLPHGCRICAAPLSASNIAICGQCLNHPPAYERIASSCLYREPLSQLIANYKYHGALYLSALFADLLAQAYSESGLRRHTVMVPVPLHRTRLRERGFNQALELSKRLVDPLGIPCEFDAVQRARYTSPQQGLSARQRRTNIRRSFAVEQDFSGARVLIIDDVVTTGATVNELALKLKQAGAASVSVLAIARAASQ